MKKFLSLVALFFVIANVQVLASDIFVQPAIISKTTEQDRVWVGTFQLAWNEFLDKIIHGIVRFRDGNPATLRTLNARTFEETDITDKTYYTYVSKIKKDTKNKISKAIAKKFGEVSDILDTLDLTPAKNRYIVYAMLKKDFEFLHEFDKLGSSDFGKGMTAEYFGINGDTDASAREAVKVLFYNNSQDYAVVLYANGKDEVYVYKNNANKPFNYLYKDMISKSKTYDGDKNFTKFDELKVPNINFFVEKSFDDLIDKRIMGTNQFIQQAVETVKFDMNSRGVELKSEAAITTVGATLNTEEEEEVVKNPRLFYFDDTFVIFLKEKDKSVPYMALRVHDISKFQ